MYAAALGLIDVAITLLRGDSNPWLKDYLYGNQDFIHYASRQDHWHLVIATLDYLRQSSKYTSQQVQSLLNIAIILWAGNDRKSRKSNHFKSLLVWGADPEVIFKERWKDHPEELDNTLLHCITNSTDLDSLLASSFKNFNHPNSIGTQPIMKIATLGDAHLVQRCIAGGSMVNNQDYEGRTALHYTMEEVWSSFFQLEHDQSQLRSGEMACAKSLLEADADPFYGDFCRCACSKSVCTPGHIILKDHLNFQRPVAHIHSLSTSGALNGLITEFRWRLSLRQTGCN
jgi:hypothetical protein